MILSIFSPYPPQVKLELWEANRECESQAGNSRVHCSSSSRGSPQLQGFSTGHCSSPASLWAVCPQQEGCSSPWHSCITGLLYKMALEQGRAQQGEGTSCRWQGNPLGEQIWGCPMPSVEGRFVHSSQVEPQLLILGFSGPPQLHCLANWLLGCFAGSPEGQVVSPQNEGVHPYAPQCLAPIPSSPG